MNRISSIRNSLFVVSIAILLAVCGMYAYLYQRTDTLIARTIEARKAVDNAVATREQSKEIMFLHSKTDTLRLDIKKYFVPESDAVSFIKKVESIGRATGSTVAISTIKTAPPKDGARDNIGEVTANVSVTGSWSEVMRALELFEVLPYRSEMNNLALAMTSGGSIIDKDAPRDRVWRLSFDIAVSSIQ